MEPSVRRAERDAWPGHDGQLPHRRPCRHGDCDRRRAAAPLLDGVGAARRRCDDRHPAFRRKRQICRHADELRAAGRARRQGREGAAGKEKLGGDPSPRFDGERVMIRDKHRFNLSGGDLCAACIPRIPPCPMSPPRTATRQWSITAAGGPV
ncbi:hypothetical protein MPLDJ20_250011 [Mesorhizobium plurifarium]|uniref:Uncharacterized protein n=1 Tax=Mesorhizobium plurifarium TaxID=69974 RepID=A0A090F5Y5_MESPL|nr:hypothetical protein MPLDJ20_250011 [Mesorhizobium plurifarium]